MLYVILSCDILFLHALSVTVCNVQPVKRHLLTLYLDLFFLLVIKQINVSKLILSVKPNSPDTYCCLFLFRNSATVDSKEHLLL